MADTDTNWLDEIIKKHYPHDMAMLDIGGLKQAITKAVAEARIDEWRLILEADPTSDIMINDVPDDFISVPGFWIKKRLAKLKAKELINAGEVTE